MLRTEEKRTITIYSGNPERIHRLVSKLLLGGERWEITWSVNEITIQTTANHMSCLARCLTNPFFMFLMEDLSSSSFRENEQWQIWKSDRRFQDYLLTDERYESVKQELYQDILHEQMSVDGWLSRFTEFNPLIQEIEADLQQGSVSDKLTAGGWT